MSRAVTFNCGRSDHRADISGVIVGKARVDIAKVFAKGLPGGVPGDVHRDAFGLVGRVLGQERREEPCNEGVPEGIDAVVGPEPERDLHGQAEPLGVIPAPGLCNGIPRLAENGLPKERVVRMEPGQVRDFGQQHIGNPLGGEPAVLGLDQQPARAGIDAGDQQTGDLDGPQEIVGDELNEKAQHRVVLFQVGENGVDLFGGKALVARRPDVLDGLYPLDRVGQQVIVLDQGLKEIVQGRAGVVRIGRAVFLQDIIEVLLDHRFGDRGYVAVAEPVPVQPSLEEAQPAAEIDEPAGVDVGLIIQDELAGLLDGEFLLNVELQRGVVAERVVKAVGKNLRERLAEDLARLAALAQGLVLVQAGIYRGVAL